MKKYLAVFMAIFILFSLFGCTQKESKINDEWGIELSCKDITKTGLTLVITQSGGNPTGELQYGEPYTLEVLENGEFTKVKETIMCDWAWNMIAYSVPKNHVSEKEIDWDWLYGELPNGTYRLSKEFMDFRATGDYDTKTYSVEFSILTERIDCY